jgi:hypothetical protein
MVGGVVISLALRATGHLAAWVVWHTTRISILEDLSAPQPPHPRID